MSVRSNEVKQITYYDTHIRPVSGHSQGQVRLYGCEMKGNSWFEGLQMDLPLHVFYFSFFF